MKRLDNLIFSIDFDDTIVTTSFPRIEGVKPFAKEVITEWKEAGAFIVVNTCRSGNFELDARKFLVENEIPFDLINNNHPTLIEHFGDCRKIFGDVIIDDKCLWFQAGAKGADMNWKALAAAVEETIPFIHPLLSKIRPALEVAI